MKLFLDTANLDEIRRAGSWGAIDGVTTNPSLVAREGKDFRETIVRICESVEGPVSAEVVAVDVEGMLNEAREMATWHSNVVVKIPMGPAGMQAVRVLRKDGIRTNVTLCFSANQALLAAKAGADYASLFVGRLDDAGLDGMEVVRQTVAIFESYGFGSQVIVGSIRHPQHVTQAALAGAHVATLPFSVLEALFKHPFTDAGLKRFLDDWRAAQRP